MSSISNPITFSGSSTYSADFQNVLTRAVTLASQPLKAMQTTVSVLQSQQSALAGMFANFTALQTALQAVGSAAPGGTSAVVSNTAALSASVSTGALPGVYTLQVDDVGSSTTTISKEGLTTVTDPTASDISSASSFTLTVNGTAHSIVPAGTSLEALATAINSASDGVQATIVNVGSNTAPDYRLALTSATLGADTIQLNDGTNDLLDTLSTGEPAQYRVNGTGDEIQSNSTQVTLSPGLTVNLLQPSTSPVTITVSTNYNALQSALGNFASAYNAAADALTGQRGQNGGALTGQSVVYSLTNVLQSISQYTSGAGSVATLTGIGLSIDENGHLNFDATAFAAANPVAVQQFLGSVDSSGMLQAANDALNTMTDPNSGVLQSDSNSLQDQVTSENNQIVEEQTRITDLQTNLQNQLAQADAAIATLQSQANYFQLLFAAEYGTNTSKNGN